MTSVQKEIWTEQMIYANTPIYNIGGFIKIDANIDVEILKQATMEIVRQTDALRISFVEMEGVPFQVSPEVKNEPLKYLDLSQDSTVMQKVYSYMSDEMRRPFRLLEEPLYRFCLYKVAHNSYLLLAVLHHLAGDGWAFSLMAQQAATQYNILTGKRNGLCRGGAYLSFIENDEAYVKSPVYLKNRHYWKTVFNTLPEQLLYPKNCKTKQSETVEGGVHTWFIPQAQYALLGKLAQKNSVSVFHVFLGLLYVYFCRIADRDECVIGIPVLNRSLAKFKQTIGLFASMIPARFRCGRDISFVELMQYIARFLSESYRHQQLVIQILQ